MPVYNLKLRLSAYNRGVRPGKQISNKYGVLFFMKYWLIRQAYGAGSHLPNAGQTSPLGHISTGTQASNPGAPIENKIG